MFKELFLAFVLLAPAAAVTLYFARRWGFFRCPGHPIAEISGLRLLGGLAIFLGGQLLSTRLIVALLMPLVTIPLLWLLWRPRRPRPQRTWRDLFYGIATWLVAAPTAGLLGVVISFILLSFGIVITERQAPVEFFERLAQDAFMLPIAIFSLVILVPVLEELIFRGFLQSWLRGHLPRWSALTLSSLGFAAMHFALSQGMGNFVILPAIFLIGLFLGYLYERQGSLWAPIGLHITYNALGIFNTLFS